MIFSIQLDRTYAFERMGRCFLDVHDFSPYCSTYLHGSEILYLNAWDIVFWRQRNCSLPMLYFRLTHTILLFSHSWHMIVLLQHGTYVEGIKEEVVLSPAHALSLIAAGEGNPTAIPWTTICSASRPKWILLSELRPGLRWIKHVDDHDVELQHTILALEEVSLLRSFFCLFLCTVLCDHLFCFDVAHPYGVCSAPSCGI